MQTGPSFLNPPRRDHGGWVCGIVAALGFGLFALGGGSLETTARAAAGPPVAKTNGHGVSVQVTGLTLKEDHAEVGVNILNGSLVPIRFGPDDQQGCRLVDATGTALPLRFPAGEGQIQLPAGQSLNGTLYFVGFAMTATPPFRLELNATGQEDDEQAPRFAFAGLTASGGRAGTGIGAALPTTRTNGHGVSVRVKAVRVTDRGVEIEVAVLNGSRIAVRFGPNDEKNCYVKDPTGNLYLLSFPNGESLIQVLPGGNVSGTLNFGGQPPPDLRSVTLELNAKHGADEEDFPGFTFTDLPVGTAAATPASGGNRSSLKSNRPRAGVASSRAWGATHGR